MGRKRNVLQKSREIRPAAAAKPAVDVGSSGRTGRGCLKRRRAASAQERASMFPGIEPAREERQTWRVVGRLGSRRQGRETPQARSATPISFGGQRDRMTV